MSQLTGVKRTSTEPVSGVWTGVIYVGAATTGDTIDVASVIPGITHVWYAVVNGSAAERGGHAGIPSLLGCTIGGTSKVTVGTGNVLRGNMFIVASCT